MHKEPDLNLEIKLEGFYKIEAVQPDGSVRLIADWFPNLITNIGLNQWGTGGIVTWCSIGTGTSQPTVGDTALQAVAASTSSVSSNPGNVSSGPPYKWNLSKIFSFPQGAVVGNMAEIGVGWASGGTNLWSRARIKDGSGNDTTITVTAIEQLNVTYQMYLYVPMNDVTGTIDIAGVPSNFTFRAKNCTTAGWASQSGASADVLNSYYGIPGSSALYSNIVLGSITGAPSGTTAGGGTSSTRSAYVDSSLQVDIQYYTATNTGNVGANCNGCTVEAVPGRWQCSWTPGFTKDNTKTFNFTIRTSWARY